MHENHERGEIVIGKVIVRSDLLPGEDIRDRFDPTLGPPGLTEEQRRILEGLCDPVNRAPVGVVRLSRGEQAAIRAALDAIDSLSRPERVRAREVDRDFPESVAIDVDLDRRAGQQ